MMDYAKLSIEKHAQYKGKLAVQSKVPLNTREDLSTYYTPGVAAPCLEIAADPEKAYLYTRKNNSVAVVSDGTAVLGLGNIGGLAGLPVMEGKAILFKQFADIDAVPIVLSTQDPDEIIKVVEAIAPTFGGINLEDISAPNCFYIEETLKSRLNIPVFHDDQHGTAIVVLAGLINALKLVSKSFDDIKVVISGAGAAGVAIGKLLNAYGVQHIVMLDSQWAIHAARTDLNKYKAFFVPTNKDNETGYLEDVLKWADVFVGVSKPNLLWAEEVSLMNTDAIIFALSNPTPEIMPDEAKKWWAAIIATGRSDFPNQINNVLVFPAIFRGALQARIPQILDIHKIAAAEALAKCVVNPSADKIIPWAFDEWFVDAIVNAVIGVK